jgi:predicted RNase H-like nuclease (RuvC/YqgF family)
MDEKEQQQLDEKIANTEIRIGSISFTPMKLIIAGGIVSSILGALYGTFEIYKDYQDMKAAIQTYVTPDLSDINKKIAVLEQNSEKSTEYVRDINTNLKQDIRRLEGVVEQVERSSRQLQRETMADVKDMRNELREVRREVDDKIKKALDNPLSQ